MVVVTEKSAEILTVKVLRYFFQKTEFLVGKISFWPYLPNQQIYGKRLKGKNCVNHPNQTGSKV